MKACPRRSSGAIAMTTPAPAALALKLGAILLPASNERLGGARFRMTVYQPIEFAPSGDHDRDVLALTAKINDAIEQSVRRGHRNGCGFIAAGRKRAMCRARGAGSMLRLWAARALRVERDGSSLS